MVFLLVDYGGNLNLKNGDNVTALYYASPTMLSELGMREGVASASAQLSDNNALFFSPPVVQNFYPDHYY